MCKHDTAPSSGLSTPYFGLDLYGLHGYYPRMDQRQLATLTADMTSEKWRLVPVELVECHVVNLLLDKVPVESLLNAASEGPPKGGDPFPHLVSIQRSLWAEDGLSRILVWRIRGCGLMPMRVLRLE